ncbi:MAG TPA: heavy metal-binding domain-containing protein [Cyclobacteriaceae bacterium]|nr:heavy metal-binding domain-containing protein [Cyclobacteriaceae bacterium]
MKKSIATQALFILGTLVCSVIVTSCGSKAKQEQSETQDMKQDSTQVVYACSMHPEVTGKKGDKCSKCGMDLEEVKKSDSTEHHH